MTQFSSEQSTDAGGMTVDDLIDRLGVRLKDTDGEASATAGGITALAEFRAAPTIKAIGRDLARVAAFTSDDPDRARARWMRRMVMLKDRDGGATDQPLIIGIRFGAERVERNGVADLAVSANIVLDGKRIVVQPLFMVGIEYIQATQSGTFDGIRDFYGVLFTPKKPGEAYKFVPLDLADRMLIERWNGIIDQGAKLNTMHKDWQRIEPLNTSIGKPGQTMLELTPSYMVERRFHVQRGGKPLYERDGKTPVMESEWRIATRFLKTVILHPRSQEIPVVELVENGKPVYQTDGAGKAILKDGKKQPVLVLAPGPYVFSYVEYENSIVVLLRGRVGEVSSSGGIVTIEEAGEQMNPFEVLDTTEERFNYQTSRRFVGECLARPFNASNPLYVRAVEMGLVIEGQSYDVVFAQLQAFAAEALNKANALYQEAFAITLDSLRKYEAPSIQEMLGGHPLERVVKKLNPDDAAVAWMNQRLASPYSHASLFHRSLRESLIREVAKSANYQDSSLDGNGVNDATVQHEPQTQPLFSVDAHPASGESTHR